MPQVEPTSTVSQFNVEEFKELSRQIDLLYERLARGINSKTDTVVTTTAPANTDTDFQIGDSWINTSTDKVYILTNLTMVVSVLTATWIEVS